MDCKTPTKMKALVLHSVGNLVLENDIPVPEIGENEVLLKIKASGICSSDIERVFETGTYHFPTIPGHELSGQIVELGKNVDQALLYKRAVVFPLLPCGKCMACSIGEYAQCADYNYFGSRCDGGFAEYLVVPVFNLVPFSDNISYEEAALCEPAAVSLHALKLASLKPGQTVVILGTGTIGFLVAHFARLAGARKVIVCGETDKKLEYAKNNGFDTLNTTQCDVVETVLEMTDRVGADAVFECVGVSKSLEDSIRAASCFGEVIVVGNPKGDMKIAKDVYWKILRKQIMLKGSWNSSFNSYINDWKHVLTLIESKNLDLKPLITHTFKLEDHEKAFEKLRDRNEFTLKVMFTFD